MDPRIDEFLDEERAAWDPFKALDRLDDVRLDDPIAAAHDWSGRDLIGHLLGWLGDALEVAGELESSPSSPARQRSRRAFAARGDEINAEIQAAWRAMPLREVRRRSRDVPEELRRAIVAVPTSSWDADPGNLEFLRVYTIEHYADHAADLEAILAAAGPESTPSGA